MKLATILAATAAAALVACGAHTPPPELVQARADYTSAMQGNAARLVPADLHVAHEALLTAEREFDSDPGSRDTRDVAYIAMRQVERAMALGDLAAANAQITSAEQQKTQLQSSIIAAQHGQLQTDASRLAAQRGEIQRKQGELEQQRAETAAERDARIAAERKAQDAMDALSRTLEVKADTRGTVITLQAGVLFATNQAILLPGAQAQLDKVAAALETQAEHHFTVEGHTDSTGTDAINDALSTRRANAVRDYLIAKGVPADAISAHGYGSTRPVADNTTEEGRTMNRRVEIVVDREVQAAR